MCPKRAGFAAVSTSPVCEVAYRLFNPEGRSYRDALRAPRLSMRRDLDNASGRTVCPALTSVVTLRLEQITCSQSISEYGVDADLSRAEPRRTRPGPISRHTVLEPHGIAVQLARRISESALPAPIRHIPRRQLNSLQRTVDTKLTQLSFSYPEFGQKVLRFGEKSTIVTRST